MPERTVTSKTIDLTRLVDDPTWPTKHQDVLAAIQIIQHHATRTGEPLRLLDGWGEAGPDHLWVQLPDWLLDLGRHYQALYGEAGEPILQQVLRELLPFEPLH
ncbi:MAG TPA: hypothetical protein VES89_04420 [Candidatus Competibacteraceae bacterium]|nr:hypothetical protein [Candidatus Competibacteraceae bacterium]